MSKSPVAQSYTDIIPPNVWNSVQGYVASGDTQTLQSGHWRRYLIDLETCQANGGKTACRGGYVLLVEKIHNLAKSASLVDITKAAAARGVTPKQFMTRGRGKPVHLTRIFATKQAGGIDMVFVGRVADDAPNAPGQWTLFCRLPKPKQTTQYFQVHLGGVQPTDLRLIGALLCKPVPSN
ncbi:hypothetical protein [Profundibacter sp.]